MITIAADRQQLEDPALYAVTHVVGAASHDVPLRAEFRRARPLHTRETLAPKPCRCGATHAPGEPADVLVHIGRPPLGIASGRPVTLALLPDEHAGEGLDCHWVAPAPDERFTPWAATVTDVVLQVLYGEHQVIGFDLGDFAAVLGEPKRLHFSCGNDPRSVAAAAERMLTAATWPMQHTAGVMAFFSGPSHMRLRELSEVVDTITKRVAANADIVFVAAVSGESHRVALLGG